MRGTKAPAVAPVIDAHPSLLAPVSGTLDAIEHETLPQEQARIEHDLEALITQWCVQQLESASRTFLFYSVFTPISYWGPCCCQVLPALSAETENGTAGATLLRKATGLTQAAELPKSRIAYSEETGDGDFSVPTDP